MKYIYALYLIISLFALITLLSSNVIGEEILEVDEDKVIAITGSTLILTSNITVKEEGQLLITNSRIQLSIRGEYAYHISIHDFGKIIIRNSTIESLSDNSNIVLSNYGNLTLIDCTVIGFNILLSSDNSTVNIKGGHLDIEYIESTGSEFSVVGSYLPNSELHIDSERTVFEHFRGKKVLMNVTDSMIDEIDCILLEARSANKLFLNNSKITDAFLQSQVEVVVADSDFDSVMFLSPGKAINVTSRSEMRKAGGSIYAGYEMLVLRYWYLKVNTTDLADVSIPATIIVLDYSGNIIERGIADVEGVYVTPILAEIINGSKTVFIGNYKVRAQYLNYTTNSIPISLDRNIDLDLKFFNILPLKTSTKLAISHDKVRSGDPVLITGLINSSAVGEHVLITFKGPGDIRLESVIKTGEGGGL